MPEIFIVDDSVSVRKALEIAFKQHHITTRNAVSGEDALDKLDDAPFDLMITDIIMPGITGFELCQQVKANPRYAHIPVLLISGNVDEEVRREAQQVGAEDILRKPFRPDELLPIVQRFLQLSAQRRQAAEGAASVEQISSGAEPSASTAADQPSTPVPVHQSIVVATAFFNAQGQLQQSSGVALPPAVQSYARFYLNTAQALGTQLSSGHMHDVRLDFETQQIIFSHLDGYVKVEVLLKS